MSESMNVLSMHDRIFRRSGHLAVTYKYYVLVWSGYMERPDEDISFQEYHFTDEVWAYNCNTELWERWLTSGHIPSSLCGSCGLVLDDYLYVFGGFCSEGEIGNVDCLQRLDLKTLVWQLLEPGGQYPTPCDKLVGWTFDNKLYFFGGFGPIPTFSPPFLHVLDANVGPGYTRGWNNQLVVYNPASNEWEWPKVGGNAPSPRAAHAADISGDKVFIFGGRFQNVRTNDLFCLDLKEMRWSDNLTDETRAGPQGRSWHSFTFVSPDRAVVYGGYTTNNQVLNDCWELDVARVTWQRVNRKVPAMGRFYHSSNFTQQGLLTFGGFVTSLTSSPFEMDHADTMLMLDFTPKSLFRLCMDAVLSKVPRALWIGEPNGISCLPKTLEKILRLRFEQAHMLPSLSLSDQAQAS